MLVTAMFALKLLVIFMCPFMVIYYMEDPGNLTEAVCTVNMSTRFEYGNAVYIKVTYHVSPYDTRKAPYNVTHESCNDDEYDPVGYAFNCTTTKHRLNRKRLIYRGRERVWYAATTTLLILLMLMLLLVLHSPLFVNQS